MQIQQMILQVYTKNNKLYLEGWALNSLIGYVPGSKDQYYEVNENEIEDMISRVYDVEILTEYYNLPPNADIYRPPLVQKYTNKSKFLNVSHTNGFDFAKKWIKNQKPDITEEKLEEIILVAMTKLTNDYMKLENKDIYTAVECAAKDFKCDKNISIVLKTIQTIQKQKEQERNQDRYSNYFDRIDAFDYPRSTYSTNHRR